MILTEEQVKTNFEQAQDALQYKKDNGIPISINESAMLGLLVHFSDTIEAKQQEIEKLTLRGYYHESRANKADYKCPKFLYADYKIEKLRAQVARMREVLSNTSPEYHNPTDIEVLKLAHSTLRAISADDWPGMAAVADAILGIEKQIGGGKDGT